MTYFLKQQGANCSIINGEDCPEGYEVIPDNLVQQVFTLVMENRQFRLVGDTIEVAPDDKPNSFCVYDFDQQIWIDPRTEQQKYTDQCNLVNATRETYLRASDWTALNDVPIPPDQLVQWQTYRQALRDIPQQPGYPWDVVWPVPPA